MRRMKPRERVDLEELRPPARVAPQVDSSGVAAAENPPRLEGDALRLAHAGVGVGPDEDVLDELLALLLVDVRVDVVLGSGPEAHLERSDGLGPRLPCR